MADIAVDGDGQMFGVGLQAPGFGLVRIDKATARCESVGQSFSDDSRSFTSLSFVPKGTVDANEDALVTTTVEGSYVRIDVETGAFSPLGRIVLGEAKGGDIVSVKDAGTFATIGEIVGESRSESSQRIFRIDPVTGVTEGEGVAFALDSDDILGGLAFWEGTVYGFAQRPGVGFESRDRRIQRCGARRRTFTLGCGSGATPPSRPR